MLSSRTEWAGRWELWRQGNGHVKSSRGNRPRWSTGGKCLGRAQWGEIPEATN